MKNDKTRSKINSKSIDTKCNRKKSDRHFLDKLETTSHLFANKSHETLYHRGIDKHLQNRKLNQLIDIKKIDNNYWNKQYERSFYCNHVLLQEGDKLRGSLCRKRWCTTCNRIKTAELLNGYLEPLTDLAKEDTLFFVTLTAPTCKERELKAEIRKRLKTFTRIKNNMRQTYKMKLNGYRKIECTYNENQDRYHPHLHLIVQGYAEALKLLELWLKSYKNTPKERKAQMQGQHIVEITENEKIRSLKELFKYATKGSVKNSIEAHAENTIHRALVGIRIYQPYGKIKKVKQPSEAKEDITPIQNNWLSSNNEIWVFKTSIKDWTNAMNDKLVNTLDIENQVKLLRELHAESD